MQFKDVTLEARYVAWQEARGAAAERVAVPAAAAAAAAALCLMQGSLRAPHPPPARRIRYKLRLPVWRQFLECSSHPPPPRHPPVPLPPLQRCFTHHTRHVQRAWQHGQQMRLRVECGCHGPYPPEHLLPPPGPSSQKDGLAAGPRLSVMMLLVTCAASAMAIKPDGRSRNRCPPCPPAVVAVPAPPAFAASALTQSGAAAAACPSCRRRSGSAGVLTASSEAFTPGAAGR